MELNTTTPPSVLIGLRDAAIMLSLSIVTLEKYVASGALPSLKIGRRRLVESSAITDLIEQQKRAEAQLRSIKSNAATAQAKPLEELWTLAQASEFYGVTPEKMLFFAHDPRFVAPVYRRSDIDRQVNADFAAAMAKAKEERVRRNA